MSRTQRKYFRFSLLWAVLALVGVMQTDATGATVVSIMTAKTLPEATISVLDPEGGTSAGTAGADVNLAAGDIIVFRFEFTAGPDGRPVGVNHYLTEYIPDNLEVVGIRIVDENDRTIKPRFPGVSKDGCQSGSCNPSGNGTGDFTGLPCSPASANGCSASNTRSVASGSVAQSYADTGVFYSFTGDYTGAPGTDSRGVDADVRTEQNPVDDFITVVIGITMSSEPRAVATGAAFATLLGLGGTLYAHNDWDYLQVRAFGAQAGDSVTSGKGNTPFGYGSMVAGPDTYYQYEAEDVGGSIEFNQTVGPWQRVRYPGSQIGTGAASLGTGGTVTRKNISVTEGVNDGTWVTPNAPLPPSASVRLALGQARVGKPLAVEVAARVRTPFATDLVIDPDSGRNTNCGEIVGSDASSTSGGSTGGHDNPWPSYIGAPACNYLRLLVDLSANDPLVGGNVPITFSLRIKNLSVYQDRNVRLRLQNDQGTAPTSFTVSSGTVTRLTDEGSCAALDNSTDCVVFDLGNLDPSEEAVFTIEYPSGGQGAETFFLRANYIADSDGSPGNTGIPSPGYTVSAVTQVRAIAVPDLTMTWDEGAQGEATEQVATTFSGSITNTGTRDYTFDTIKMHLPSAGWTGGDLVLNGQTFSCGGSCTGQTVTYTVTAQGLLAFDATNTKNFTWSVTPPAGSGTPETLYDISVEYIGTESSFGDSNIYMRDLVQVSVGAPRTAAPSIDCSGLVSTATDITGTGTAGDEIKIYFNLEHWITTTVAGDGTWSAPIPISSNGVPGIPFGEIYGGLEILATAEASGETESVYAVCSAGVTNTRQCSDGIDNDGDGFYDFPADPGCDSPGDNGESPDLDAPECSNGQEDDVDGDIDFGADFECSGPDDDDETNGGDCTDGNDNDGDGLIDANDPSCAKNASAGFDSERDYAECQNIVDDGDSEDSVADFGTDPGCHTAFDDDETDPGPGSDVIKPRILFVFDTSGSMNSHVCALPAPGDLATDFTGGDGSFECPGSDLTDSGVCPANSTTNDGFANDSRLYKVKEGISDVVASFGEVEYGLMRFKQRPQDFGCAGTADNFGSGAWIGGGVAGSDLQTTAGKNPDACNPFNEGELIVGFSPDNAQSILKWMDHDSNYGELNSSTPGVNLDAITTPYGLDWELRGTGSTPLAGALDSARTELYEVIASDPVKDCRPYRIIVVTDGLESCKGTPADIAGELFTPSDNTKPSIEVSVIGFSSGDDDLEAGLEAIAQAGSGGQESAIIVSDEAALSEAIAAIIAKSIVTEYCDGVDNDCDSKVDEGYGIYVDPNAAAGVESDTRAYTTCDNNLKGACELFGTLRCANDLPDSQVVCCGEGGERATNLGSEMWEENICDNVIGTPTPGTEKCSLDPTDEDCDGTVDEGLTCQCADEVCDGQDNDCDGNIDENPGTLPGVGEACGDVQVIPESICRPGSFTCTHDGSGNPATNALRCTGGTPPETEDQVPNPNSDCDGLDNDCDALIDEASVECYTGLTTDPTKECPTGADCIGECQRGTQSCLPAGAGPGTCQGEVLPTTELCNGLDDDCDGTIDEGLVYDPTPGMPTSGDEVPLGMACDNGADGICYAIGTAVCAINGTVTCNAPTIQPQPEVCDEFDNDCDGTVDETILTDPSDMTPGGTIGSPVGQTCQSSTCGTGTFDCVEGHIVCVGGTPSSEEVCDTQDNDCDGLFDEEFPEQGTDCTLDGDYTDGRAYGFGPNDSKTACTGDGDCTGGQICNLTLGVCVDTDAVLDVGECEYGTTVCVDGGLACQDYEGPSPETCNGLDDDCDGVIDDAAPCDAGEICYGGACIAPCEAGEFPCSFGFYCAEIPELMDNFCIPDPCVGTTCPDGFFCESATGECVDLCGDVQCSRVPSVRMASASTASRCRAPRARSAGLMATASVSVRPTSASVSSAAAGSSASRASARPSSVTPTATATSAASMASASRASAPA